MTSMLNTAHFLFWICSAKPTFLPLGKEPLLWSSTEWSLSTETGALLKVAVPLISVLCLCMKMPSVAYPLPPSCLESWLKNVISLEFSLSSSREASCRFSSSSPTETEKSAHSHNFTLQFFSTATLFYTVFLFLLLFLLLFFPLSLSPMSPILDQIDNISSQELRRWVSHLQDFNLATHVHAAWMGKLFTSPHNSRGYQLCQLVSPPDSLAAFQGQNWISSPLYSLYFLIYVSIMAAMPGH